MSLLRNEYAKILRKLELTEEELRSLKLLLNKDHVCAGPFTKGEKMCPNTIALSIKSKKRLHSTAEIRVGLNNLGISNMDLVIFYILFDLPSRLSDRMFDRSLLTLNQAVDTLIQEGAKI